MGTATPSLASIVGQSNQTLFQWVQQIEAWIAAGQAVFSQGPATIVYVMSAAEITALQSYIATIKAQLVAAVNAL